MARRKTLTLWLCLGLLLTGCASTGAKKAAQRKKSAEMRLAVKNYKEGIDAYTNSRYAEAIKHWRITLEKDPTNPNAQNYIQRAETVLKNLGQKPPPDVKKK